MKLKLFVFASATIAFVLADLALNLTHADEWWAHIPAVFALIGLAACLGIIAFGKLAGDRFLKRREDYYDVG